jgi:ankyrin repeat protein
LNDSKVLNVVKNSKAGDDELTMLHMAAKQYRQVPIQMLIDELEIDPNITSKSLKTPLHILVKTEKIYEKKMGLFEEKFIKSFESLVNRNANINAVDDIKMSVLQYAVMANNTKAVELLLKLPEIDVYVSYDFLQTFIPEKS